MRRSIGTLAAVAALFSLALAGTAVAKPAPKPANPEWKTFGNAKWYDGVGNDSKKGLVTYADGTGNVYGGIDLVRGFETDPAKVQKISFDFAGDRDGTSLGSPRLEIVFSDGGDAALRPLTWNAFSYQTVDGMTGTSWDNNSGGCGYRYAVSWDAILLCHPGATVTDVFAVEDNGPAPAGTREYVALDNITYGTAVASGPGHSS